MKISLIGFMGSGKTEISSLLSKRLGLKKVEMDDLVLERSGRKTINEIFEKDGETRFRELEIEVAKDLRGAKNVVISTGGGVVINKIILDYLREDGVVIFLGASFESILERLKNDDSRPLFKDKEVARKIYDFRDPLYREYADFAISTDRKSPARITNEIIARL